MLLDSPAFQLRIGVNDTMGILDRILKDRHWKNFDVASLKLRYVPYWFFNYDVYQESQGQSQTYSSQMCMQALDGHLEPVLISILGSIPVEKSKEITHDTEFSMEKPLIKKEEVTELAKIRVAGQMGIGKDAITITGINLVFVPIWRVWASIRGTQMIDIDGISGSPLNISSVPERERGMMEVTADMIEDLKTPQGWMDYSKKAFNWGLGVVSNAGKAGSTSGVVNWLTTTRNGHYTLLLLVIFLLFVYYLYR